MKFFVPIVLAATVLANNNGKPAAPKPAETKPSVDVQQLIDQLMNNVNNGAAMATMSGAEIATIGIDAFTTAVTKGYGHGRPHGRCGTSVLGNLSNLLSGKVDLVSVLECIVGNDVGIVPVKKLIRPVLYVPAEILGKVSAQQ